MSELLNKHLYTDKNIHYIKGSRIFEYDIKDAGFSIIKNKELLPSSVIKSLGKLKKEQKNIEIGKLMKYTPDLSTMMMNEFIKIRQEFGHQNSIISSDILAIKKDAIFTINKLCKNLFINNYEFTLRNRYSSFLNLGGLEFYYNYNKLDVKGINIEKQNLHRKYMFTFINDLLRLCEETENQDKIFTYLKNFRTKYLTRNLDYRFYRELNQDSMFLYKRSNPLRVYLEEIPLSMVKELDILYNYKNIFIELINYIL